MAYVNFVTDASGNNMHYSNADVDKYLEEGRHGETEEARKEAYSEFEKAYAEAPGILLVAYLQGDYVGVSGLDGLDTTRVLGHHSVGVMWNIEDWTLQNKEKIMQETVLELKNYSVSFDTPDGEVQAVRNVDLTVKKGEILCIVGESGCGKTVMCRSVMKLLPPNAHVKSGEISLCGENITAYKRKKNGKAVRK